MTRSAAAPELRAFRYRSATKNGEVRAGEVLAPSTSAAVATIRERGEWPLEITVAPLRLGRARRIPVRDLGTGFRVLATILEAKVPPGKVMRVAAPSLPSPWQSSIGAVSAALESGESFSSAIRTGGIDVPPIVDGLLRAGEAAGDLSGALRRSAELAEKSAAMRALVVDALAYPALLLVAGAGVIGLLVSVVIPRFTEVLTNLGQQLPTSTRLVLGAASVIRIGILPAVAVALALTIAFAKWRRSALGKRAWHEWLLSMPVLGDLRHAFGTARVAASLAALLDCGMPVARAIPFAASSSGDAAMEERLRIAHQRVVEGEPIARAFEATNALTDNATRLIGAGEAGGALSALLRHAATLEGERAAVKTKTLMRIVEPALIVLLGAIVSGVAVALLQAVYSVRVDQL